MAEKKAFLLRVDRDLLAAVQRWADDEFRSVNGQIEFVLREALRTAGRTAKAADGTRSIPAAASSNQPERPPKAP